MRLIALILVFTILITACATEATPAPQAAVTVMAAALPTGTAPAVPSATAPAPTATPAEEEPSNRRASRTFPTAGHGGSLPYAHQRAGRAGGPGVSGAGRLAPARRGAGL
jgi:hypothetical protein